MYKNNVLSVIMIMMILGVSILTVSMVLGDVMPSIAYPSYSSANVSTDYYYINVSLNGTASIVYLEWWNITNTSAGTGVWQNFTMLNVTGAGSKHFYYNVTNSTTYGFSEMSYNYTIYVYDGKWNKTTGKVTIDRINPTIPTAVAQTTQVVTGKNGTKDTFRYFNFTFYDINPKNCTLELSNATIANHTMTMVIQSDGNSICSFNATNIRSAELNQIYNYTIYATDASSRTVKTGLFYMTVDTVVPIITVPVYTQYNTSVDKLINFTFSVRDNHTDSAGANIYQEDGTKAWKPAAAMNASTGTDVAYQIQINTSDITQDGDVIVEVFANDTAGNEARATNITLLASFLYTGWNIISKTDVNETLLNFCDGIPTCTHVSAFSNDENLSYDPSSSTAAGNMFTNYAKATRSVNNDTILDYGDAFFIYVSANTLYLRNTTYINQIAGVQNKENLTLNPYNSTNATLAGWNLFALYADKTANQTMRWHVNITDMAVYNNTNGDWYVGTKDWEYMTGGWNATTYKVMKSNAIWLLVNYTVIVNRSVHTNYHG